MVKINVTKLLSSTKEFLKSSCVPLSLLANLIERCKHSITQFMNKRLTNIKHIGIRECNRKIHNKSKITRKISFK
ncbi:hypothetical protein Lalb_Chr18g0047031 [Lupinus albus]|uniref:Uncharacterized protein n=1 Tax=Lupinus albus TaxID=3870 RepID=A0A6A4NXI3_LUPAL|nr:hypothetical protein Lalb_Chr18g0047031 [Lupinus albus]